MKDERRRDERKWKNTERTRFMERISQAYCFGVEEYFASHPPVRANPATCTHIIRVQMDKMANVDWERVNNRPKWFETSSLWLWQSLWHDNELSTGMNAKSQNLKQITLFFPCLNSNEQLGILSPFSFLHSLPINFQRHCLWYCYCLSNLSSPWHRRENPPVLLCCFCNEKA